MLYFFNNSVVLLTAVYGLYTLSIIMYPFLKFSLKSKHLILVYASLLGFIILIYMGEIKSIFFLQKTIYVDFLNLLTSLNIVNYSFSFSLSPISFSFSLLVLIIGFCTNIYILNYFKGEADEGGFIVWVNAFIVSMLLLVLSNNFFTLFLGWELIGFTSFFLINFWQSKRSTLKSSFKAFSFNLISDLFLLGALVNFYQISNTTDISAFLYISSLGGAVDMSTLSVGVGLLIGCASIKSVQLIGHLWLPDSMEAPVPASALIHSATLVSAGIYLLIRFNILLVLGDWLTVLIILGSLTAAYGGVIAASQTDMKKLLAYSTMSHCGFLMVLVACSNFYVLITYLFLHGFYKAATFFCAGSFIRIYGSQDTRLMGSINQVFIGDSILLIICAGNLAGLPLTVGVMYKTFFLSLIAFYNIGLIGGGLILLGLLTGAIYFYRLVFYSVFDKSKWTNLSVYELLEVVQVKFIINHTIINKNHLVATLFLLIFSIGFSFALIGLSLVEAIEVGVGIYGNLVPTYLYSSIIHIYLTYWIYFYLAYLSVILSLLFMAWRYQFIFGLKETVLIYIYMVLVFGALIVVLV